MEIADKMSEAKSAGVATRKENTLVSLPNVSCQPQVGVFL